VKRGATIGANATILCGHTIGAYAFIGTDISAAVDVVRARFAERGIAAAFIQADLHALPLAPGAVDVIFAEGVLHHTDSTERALACLAALLKPGGWFLFYVYRRKGPIGEFTDDFVRARLAAMAPEAAWAALRPLTRLGATLGELAITLDVTEPVDLLGIPAGPIDLQRFFHWHVIKAFYRPDLGFEEMHRINFDWFAPTNAHR
jgi:arsenite methyltransferase